MTNQKLKHICRGLFSDSPQTTEIHIPEDMGTGRISQVVTKRGIVLADWRMNYASDMEVSGINREDYIQLLFCLNEGVSWNIAGERQSIAIRRGESCIYRGHGKMEYLCYPKNSDFRFKSIKIPVTDFRHLLENYIEPSDMGAYEKKLMQGIAKIEITPHMEHIFAELNDFTQYHGGLGNLFLEGKIQELLAVCLGEALETPVLASACAGLSKSDRESILEAKRIIDSRLSFAPGCVELARLVNVSTSKLTKGFTAMLGMSVHAYIIDQRLEKAAGLLLEGRLNVSQAAALVGYAKPSNFSAAFKKKYGVVPKTYKQLKRN